MCRLDKRQALANHAASPLDSWSSTLTYVPSDTHPIGAELEAHNSPLTPAFFSASLSVESGLSGARDQMPHSA